MYVRGECVSRPFVYLWMVPTILNLILVLITPVYVLSVENFNLNVFGKRCNVTVTEEVLDGVSSVIFIPVGSSKLWLFDSNE